VILQYNNDSISNQCDPTIKELRHSLISVSEILHGRMVNQIEARTDFKFNIKLFYQFNNNFKQEKYVLIQTFNELFNNKLNIKLQILSCK